MLPVPIEVLKEIKNCAYDEKNFSPIYYALPDNSFAALNAVIAIGREVLADSEWIVSHEDYYHEYEAAKERLANSPHGSRSQMAGIIAIGRYLEEGLKPAEKLGVPFIPLREYWSAANAQASGENYQQIESSSSPSGFVGRKKETFSYEKTSSQSYSFQSKVEPTEEQEFVLDAARNAHSDGVIKAEAFAGTGKTTLCGFIGQEMQHQSTIYLAFNKPMANQAWHKLRNVVRDCRTTDSLAYKTVKPWNVWGQERTEKNLRMPFTQIADNLGLPRMLGIYKKGILARQVYQTVMNYCYSNSPELDFSHIPEMTLPEGGEDEILSWARDLWALMLLENSTLPVVPAQVMKYWDLKEGTIPHDLVLFDEAQDANGAFMSILNRSDCQRVLIGDHHQQLYDWRGAVNAMAKIDGNAFPLTQSWRFGSAIADYANIILSKKSTPPDERV